METQGWHALGKEEALGLLEARPEGLSHEEAAARLARHGPNRLPAAKRASLLGRLGRQFNNVLIYVLFASAAGTALMRMWLDTAVILGVVLINGIIGFIQEGKAERALDAIRGMLTAKALAVRDGHRQTIEAEDLVPGDVVQLTAGDQVPADLRLLQASNLQIDESILTGESLPVAKQVEKVEAQAELGDRSSMAFSGTMVVAGQGRAVVVATGQKTQIGKVSALLEEVEELTTPLLRQIAQFGRWLAIFTVALSAFIFAFGYWVRGYPAVDIFLAAVSFAVAAIPEGLPAIMTITLAIGVQRMARRKAIIRRLPAVETLGAVTTICSDKTGTLTRNEMTVKVVLTSERRVEVEGVGYQPEGGFLAGEEELDPLSDDPVLAEALRVGLLCNEARLRHHDGKWQLEGEPTDGALVTAAVKAGLEPAALRAQFPRVDVIPFDSAHRFMATLNHDHQGRHFICLKGAPEKVLGMCAKVRGREGDLPLDHERWNRATEALASEGRRLLAIAVKEVPSACCELDFAQVEEGLVLLAVMGIIDPPRAEAVAAVARCKEAGIRVKMITGDHRLTAATVSLELGIGDGEVVTGHQLDQTSDDDLREVAARVDVYARASPENKLRLVRALQSNEQVVAMTGDGVNDSPALKRADVGIAMGIKGTEAAKAAAEMVLVDDNFASIADAVEEGRTVYDNLRKTLLFLLPTNGAQGFTILVAILLGLPLPLSPVQVLWVNMVTAVTLAMALGFEPTEPGVMQRRPRDPGRPLLSGFVLWRVGFVSVLLVAGTLGHFLWMQRQGWPVEVSRTAAINTLVAGQVFYLFSSRFIRGSSLSFKAVWGSRAVRIAVAVLIVLQLAFTYLQPMNALFGTSPLELSHWIRILAFGAVVFLAVELEKALLRAKP